MSDTIWNFRGYLEKKGSTTLTDEDWYELIKIRQNRIAQDHVFRYGTLDKLGSHPAVPQKVNKTGVAPKKWLRLKEVLVRHKDKSQFDGRIIAGVYHRPSVKPATKGMFRWVKVKPMDLEKDSVRFVGYLFGIQRNGELVLLWICAKVTNTETPIEYYLIEEKDNAPAAICREIGCTPYILWRQLGMFFLELHEIRERQASTVKDLRDDLMKEQHQAEFLMDIGQIPRQYRDALDENTGQPDKEAAKAS